jgi:cytochrome c biogenesis protein CcmG, thiol:disulfide interchange protein DsbE
MKKLMLMFLVLALFASLALAQEEKNDTKKAPDFVLKNVDGQDYQLSKNLEKGPIVMNFWATWCVPCIEELKKEKHIYDEYSKKGVQFLAVSVDDPKTVGRVNSFVKSHRYGFTVLLDTNSEVMRLYQGTVPPYTVLIDKDGNIVYTHVGYRVGDEKKLEQELQKLLD